MAHSNQKQKWEYAYISYYWGVNDRWLSLTYLKADGPKVTVVKKKGAFAEELNYLMQRQQWITQLGQDGYEMVNYTNAPNHNVTDEDFWFKRPVQD